MESGALSTLLCPKERSAGSPTCSLLGDPTPLPLLPLHPSRRNSHSIPPPIVLSSRHPSPVSSTSGGLFLTCLHTSSLNLVLLFLFSFKSCPVTSGNSFPFFVLFLEPKLGGKKNTKNQLLVMVSIYEIYAMISLLTNDLITKSCG